MSNTSHLATFAILTTVGLLLTLLPWLDRNDARVRRGFFYTFCALKLTYLLWRLSTTLPSPGWSLPVVYAYFFFLLELQVTVALYRWLKGMLSHKERSREADANADWFRHGASLPVVDILVPTYNEPWNVVEKTLVGALEQTYPCRVWILDDGRREWLKQECSRLNVGYVTRADNLHAKAGNLNSGLAHLATLDVRSDFVAVLDADFIPRPRFVERALSLMHDSKVGIVQTPQYHLNPDPFQLKFRARAGWPDTQRFAFGCFLPARDAEGGAYCCGTSFIARAEALEKIGGFPTDSVTEDVLTSVKMGMSGYRTVFLGELLSTGLAAEGLHEYLTQRGRWCLGTVQLGMWLFDLDKEKRSLWSRFWGSEGCFRWGYTSLFRLFFLCVPVVYWLSGVAPFSATTSQVLLFAVPVMILQRVFIAWMSRGTQLPLIYEASSLLANFVVVRALFKGITQRRNHRFAVTDKGVSSQTMVIHWGTLRWFVGYTVLLVGAAIYAHYGSTGHARLGGFQHVNLLWTCINLALVAIAAAPCFEEPRRRREERYDTTEAVLLQGTAWGEAPLRAHLLDLSVSGCRIRSPQPLTIGERLSVTLNPQLSLAAEVVRGVRDGSFGLRFSLSDQERRALVSRIFCTSKYVVPQEEGSAVLTFQAVLKTAFR